MRLRDLLKYNEIVIQCHDNPDADALGSGFALYTYLLEQGKKVSLIYAGANRIRKSNLMLMIQELNIPIKYCDSVASPELLVTIDCRYGEGNVTHFPARNIAVIDHHKVTGTLPELSEVRSNLGSCSTLLWEMLKQEGFNVNGNRQLATAMYYGLYTDTNELVEIAHPLDRDLRDEAKFDAALITRFRNANLSLEELDIAGAALLRSDYNEDYRFAVVRANPCDPNILGIISDLVLAVDIVDTCMVFCIDRAGVKISVRSCIKEVKANELAQYICDGIGSGGGHVVKAGGRINLDLLTREYIAYCDCRQIRPRMEMADDGSYSRPTVSGIKFFLEKRIREYYGSTEIIYYNNYQTDAYATKDYEMRPRKSGFVRLDELYPVNTIVVVRTLDGDMEVMVRKGNVLLVGMEGDISVLKGDFFKEKYSVVIDEFQYENIEYNPTIKGSGDDKVLFLFEQAKSCIYNEKVHVRARQLERKTKLFSKWNHNDYSIGDVGDYLVIDDLDPQDLQIIKKDVFERYYKEV